MNEYIVQKKLFTAQLRVLIYNLTGKILFQYPPNFSYTHKLQPYTLLPQTKSKNSSLLWPAMIILPNFSRKTPVFFPINASTQIPPSHMKNPNFWCHLFPHKKGEKPSHQLWHQNLTLDCSLIHVLLAPNT